MSVVLYTGYVVTEHEGNMNIDNIKLIIWFIYYKVCSLYKCYIVTEHEKTI